MGIDPLQGANIALSLWQLLHGEFEPPDKESDRPAPEPRARESSDPAFEAMRERMDRLVLVVHAMWALMAEKTGVTEADLMKRITELDGTDGAVDGRVTPAPVRCSCGAMVCRKLNRCLFCGKAYEAGTTFDTL
jgi:hypothetical protein